MTSYDKRDVITPGEAIKIGMPYLGKVLEDIIEENAAKNPLYYANRPLAVAVEEVRLGMY